MSLGERVNSVPAFWFEVEVDDKPWAVVQTVSGLGASWEQPLEIWEDASHYRIVPTKKKWSNIVLKGAVVNEKKFFKWFEDVTIGKIKDARKGVTIHLVQAGKTVATWHARDAFPLKYTAPSFDTNSTAIAFETIEITHLELKREP